MSLTPDEINQMLHDCEVRESRLNDWERAFIDSISTRLTLSPAQQDKLEQIWNKVTEDG